MNRNFGIVAFVLAGFGVWGGFLEARAEGPVQGRLGSVRSSRAAAEPGSRPLTGSDLQSEPAGTGRSLVIIEERATGTETPSSRPFSDLEYGRIVRALLRMGTTPLAINYETGQSILPAGFERQVLQADFQPVALEARVIDVLDRGVLLVPTREMIRLRGARIPSQLTGTESARGAGREAMRILRNLARSGNLTIIPGAPVRDNSGAILVTVPDDQSRNLAFMLVREGLAMAEPGDFDTADAAISRAFQRAQSDARRERLGLWGRR